MIKLIAGYICLIKFSSLLHLLLFTGAANAVDANADFAATEQVKAQLISSVETVKAGDEIYLGVHQRIAPHWHTYWLNPGDSGIATTIQWALPKGASASDILWPIPSRHRMGPVTNYGYADEVTLLSKVKVPSDIEVGTYFSLQATVDWLVCHEECIPQQATLSLTLPVSETSKVSRSGKLLVNKALSQQPVASPWPLSAQLGKDGLTLNIHRKSIHGSENAHSTELTSTQVQDVWFYPEKWGNISQSADQSRQVDGEFTRIKLRAGDAPLKAGEPLIGVLVVTEQSGSGTISRGFKVNLIPQSIAADAVSVSTQSSVPNVDLGFFTAILLALLGGIILNLMPCVFPVLSIKALSLVSHANHSPLETRLQGLVYTLGVLASFALLGAILIALKAGGSQIGWGFQFQSPLFVLAVAYLMFAVGLNLSGVFAIGGSIAGVGSSLADKPGYLGSFFTGVLATVVATPCTAPFMATALGYALSQPALKLMAIFLSLGLGLALPYLLLTSWPALQKRLPRPGVWMEHAKQILAFPMYAAAVWLVWVLAQQAGANAVAIALGGMVVIAFSAWLYEATRNANRYAQNGGTTMATVALLVAFTVSYIGINAKEANAATSAVTLNDTEKHWESYTPARLEKLLAEGKPVFLNFTAAWCISCLVNERVALSNSEVTRAFDQSGITYLKGDWTNRDADITEILSRFGRSGVPLYVFYPAGANSKPIELPQILTPEIVLSTIKQ